MHTVIDAARNWHQWAGTAALCMLLLPGPVPQAADADDCLSFKWDISAERALFSAASGQVLAAGGSPPVTIPVGQAVDLALRPQAEVGFDAAPGKPSLTDGAFAGQARFAVDRPGMYRIAIDGPFWIDVLAGGEPLASVDFGGPVRCAGGPTKLVTYDLPTGQPLVLQLSGAPNPRVRVSIIPVQTGRVPADARRTPLSFIPLAPADAARRELGRAVFNTQWVPEGITGAGRRDGVGPLFNAVSCDACHNSGARGGGPDGDGPAPQALVLALGRLDDNPAGDPRYGHVLSPNAAPGTEPEATVSLGFSERTGTYADGSRWTLRVPEILITGLAADPLDADTVLRPRLAPPVFGTGLLEAATTESISGPLNWQGTAASIREQTGRAFAREMGLSSAAMGAADCELPGHLCGIATGDQPEVADELLEALLLFQATLGVPVTPSAQAPDDAARGERLFTAIGCTACHRPTLPVRYPAPDGRVLEGSIAAYSDLLLHDLGADLADRTVAGRVVPTRWRTAPLWGHRAGIRPERVAYLLHDGRARSVTEAILWHGGEAGEAREGFRRLAAADRRTLAGWIESL